MLMPAPIEAARPTRKVRGEGGREQRRQRRDRAVHQAGEARLDVLQHEHAPLRPFLRRAHVGLEDLAGQPGGEVLVALLDFREIAEQPANVDVLGPLGGPCVEALGLELHRLDLLADGLERQVPGEPDRPAAQEALDVLAPNRRKILAEALLVHLQQHVAMVLLFFRHLLEQLRRVRIALGEVLRKAHVDAAVFLLGRDRDGQHFTLGEIGEILHGRPCLLIPATLDRYGRG
jgi:hypothetical protein